MSENVQRSFGEQFMKFLWKQSTTVVDHGTQFPCAGREKSFLSEGKPNNVLCAFCIYCLFAIIHVLSLLVMIFIIFSHYNEWIKCKECCTISCGEWWYYVRCVWMCSVHSALCKCSAVYKKIAARVSTHTSTSTYNAECSWTLLDHRCVCTSALRYAVCGCIKWMYFVI